MVLEESNSVLACCNQSYCNDFVVTETPTTQATRVTTKEELPDETTDELPDETTNGECVGEVCVCVRERVCECESVRESGGRHGRSK